MQSDARLQAHALDDAGDGKPARLAVGVGLVEIGHVQRRARAGEELHRLGLDDPEHQPRDADGAVGVGTRKFDEVGAIGRKVGELLGRGNRLGIVLGRAHHDTAGAQVVVESLGLTQELRAGHDARVARALAQRRGYPAEMVDAMA